MTDLPVSNDLLPQKRHNWRRGAIALLPVLLYSALVLALFGGVAIDHLPDNGLAQLCMVAGGAIVLLLAAFWLDRREGGAARARSDEALGTGD